MVLFLALRILLTALVVWLGLGVVRWLKRWWAVRQLPGPPRKGLVGADPACFQRQRHRLILDWTNKYGSIFGFRFLHMNFVVVTDPELAAEVLSRDGRFDKPHESYAVFNEMTNGRDGIFSAPSNAQWKAVRKGVAPAFNSSNIKHGFHLLLNVLDKMTVVLKQLGPGAVVDMDNAAMRESLDVIGLVGFGKDFGATKGVAAVGSGGGDDDPGSMLSLTGTCLGQLLKDMQVPQALREWVAPFSKMMRAHRVNYRALFAISEGLVAEVKSRGPVSPTDTTIAAHLLRVRDPETGGPLADDKLAAEFLTFFVAGFETSAHTIAWTLFLVSQHPEVEAKVIAELDAVGLLVTTSRPSPRAMTFDDLAAVPYTSAAIKESMRMLPVASDGSFRTPVKDTTLGGYRLPAGTQVWVPFMSMFNSRHTWEQPDKYMPERWLEPGAEYMPMKSAVVGNKGAADGAAVGAGKAAGKAARRFFPFADGTRDCVGQSLARMNYLTTVAVLLSRFHFELAPEMGGMEGVRATEAMKLTLSPSKGMLMHAHPRPLQ